MSIWKHIENLITALGLGEGLVALIERLRAAPAPEKSVGFTIAVIALAAKIAKADGRVTRDEVTSFRQIFSIAEEDLPHAAKVYNLARQDTAGYETYARQIARLFQNPNLASSDPNHILLIDLLEGLFQISMADGQFHPAEDQYLRNVAQIFGLNDRSYAQIRARCVETAERDPYDVLGLQAEATLDDARRAWRKAVIDNHPDKLIARGVPKEAIQLAERRLIAINQAWQDIQLQSAA